jgi:hypothetical protein
MSQVQLTTDVKNFHKLSLAINTSSSVPNRIVTGTKPTNVTAAVDTPGSVIIGASLNYLKIKGYTSATASVPTLYIYGWNYSSQINCFVPQLLTSITTSVNSASQSLQSVGTVYELATYTKSTGDIKSFSGTAGTGNGGFFLVDTLGSEFVEICAVSASSTANMTFFVAGL